MLWLEKIHQKHINDKHWWSGWRKSCLVRGSSGTTPIFLHLSFLAAADLSRGLSRQDQPAPPLSTRRDALPCSLSPEPPLRPHPLHPRHQRSGHLPRLLIHRPPQQPPIAVYFVSPGCCPLPNFFLSPLLLFLFRKKSAFLLLEDKIAARKSVRFASWASHWISLSSPNCVLN